MRNLTDDMTEAAAAHRCADGCHYAHHHPAHSPIWIPTCQLCGHIDGQDIKRQVDEKLAAQREQLGLEIHDFAKQAAKTDTADAIIGLLTAKAIVTGKQHPDMDSFAAEVDEVLAAGDAAKIAGYEGELVHERIIRPLPPPLSIALPCGCWTDPMGHGLARAVICPQYQLPTVQKGQQ